jgi:DNA invertase Pin-like site-specific DNA recombinase
MVQARVLDGTARLTAAIPPIGDRLSATLRRYVVRNVTLDDLVARDSLSRVAAGFLRALMQVRSRIAVSGEPGAGKTTLAAALLAAAPPTHCVRSCEEIRELAVPITHGSYYEVRPPALDGTGEITMRDLVKFVLTNLGLRYPEGGMATKSTTRKTATIAGVYVRISQDRNGDELGVDRQRQDCERLAKRRGWKIGEVFVDDDRSAYSGKPRPGYDRLLDAVKDGTIGAVVAWHPDRLHRSPRDLEDFIDVIEASGAAVATVQSGELDLSTASGRMVARVVGAMARHESEQKSERICRQREQMATQGRPHGGRRAFGYDKSGTTIIDAEAKLIREAVARVLAGESLRAIATDWNDRRIASSSGREWTIVSLRSMLTGPRLAGLRVHRGEVVGNGSWQAIITRAEHDEIRALFGNPRVRRVGRPATSLLGGILRCACGARMVHSIRSDGARRYVCQAQPGKDGCGRVAIQAERTEQTVTDDVLRHLDGPGLARMRATPKGSPGREIPELEERLGDLAEMFGVGEITKAQFLRAKKPLDVRLARARNALDANASCAALAPFRDAKQLRDEWEGLGTERQRNIIAAVVDYVEITPATKGSVFDADRIVIPSVAWRG